MTAEEVRKMLELDPFEGFARKVLNQPTDPMADTDAIVISARHTGRTTRMLCSLLAAISHGRRCAIYAKPMPVEVAIKDTARRWAEQLQLNPDLIVGHLAPSDLEFFDHTWYDVL